MRKIAREEIAAKWLMEAHLSSCSTGRCKPVIKRLVKPMLRELDATAKPKGRKR